MKNNQIANGIAVIWEVIQAFNELKNEVADTNALELAALDLIEYSFAENTALTESHCISNGSTIDGDTIGFCRIPIDISLLMKSSIRRHIPQYLNDLFDKCISIPVKVNYEEPFSMLIQVDNDSDQAAAISQSILYSALKKNSRLNYRCADFVSGGSFFSSVHSFISKFPNKTGGKIYTQTSELSDLLKILEDASTTAITTLAGTYASVQEYNSVNQAKIDEYLTVIYLPPIERYYDELERLKVLIRNSKKTGMSYIVIGNAESVKCLAGETDFDIQFTNGFSQYGSGARIPYHTESILHITEEDVASLISSMQEAQTIDTLYENHPELHTDFFTMDSSDALRIPFAVDKNNIVQYFEIGGNAPSHALIAGTTGSGKSVALHTLIMQIVHNYHPDDVEIWAIDYKAVEFDRYIEQRSPHFRVIAHDTSTEFSLSLIDLLYDEYEKRQKLFLDAKVKNINEYRHVCGNHSMPRIVVVIDEFQLMTQAVQEYAGSTDYRTKLENLLRLTRAMGISFILCSQTIASGLSGLSDAARDQIGCRLCLKHDDDTEIRETLVLSGPTASDIASMAKEQRRGQCIYKRARWANEYSADGKAYEFIQTHIILLGEDVKTKMIDQANFLLKGKHQPKDEIIVRGGGRISVGEKIRHPLTKFIRSEFEVDEECIEWYPAAPTTLADAFCLKIDNSAAANILLVGEDDNLRESIVIHSILGFLMNPGNRIIASFVDENYPDRARLINHLKQIQSSRLAINTGVSVVMETIKSIRRIRPTAYGNTIYLWYGLDKLKNELFLLNQEAEEEQAFQASVVPSSREDMMADLMGFLSDITCTSASKVETAPVAKDILSFEDCKTILKQAFEVGPDNNMIHMAIFNNRKTMKKCGLIDLDNFENRIGSRMSTDDSYELFGSSLAISKTNENTVIYYDGSGQAIPLRPYLIPNEQWYRDFNLALSNL